MDDTPTQHPIRSYNKVDFAAVEQRIVANLWDTMSRAMCGVSREYIKRTVYFMLIRFSPIGVEYDFQQGD